jgi:hypothetical protein
VFEEADEEGLKPCLQSVHFLAPRVIYAKAYVLRLLLLLCGPDKVQTLLPPPDQWEPVALPVDDSVEQDGEKGGGPSIAAADADAVSPDATLTARGLRSLARERGRAENETRNTSHCRNFAPGDEDEGEDDDDQENEDDIEGRKMVYLWECRRGGFAPLTAKELNRINTQAQAALGSDRKCSALL